jgi:short-subunit dehydrogenase
LARNLKDAVVVITGASSGIGRATAIEFASKGAHVVLAARREDALRDVAAECEALGVRALAVPTDVTDEVAVEALAARASEEFGRVDVWVNNAGVAMYGLFEDTPAESSRRVVEINLLGVIHGSHAALGLMRERGSGVIINMSSGFGRFAAAYQATYVATKFGVRGFSEALRLDLKGTDIQVCTVFPTSIDTPVYRYAANYTGHELRPLGRLLEPEKVARTVVDLARNPRREVAVGQSVRSLNVLRALAPSLFEMSTSRQAVQKQLLQDEAAPPGPGNLFEPVGTWTGVSGGYKQQRRGGLRRALRAGLLASAPAAGVLLWRRARDTSGR